MKPARTDIDFMRLALRQAQKAQNLGEVPVGAILAHQGKVIARGYNRSIANHDAGAHAEMLTLRRAGKTLRNYRLSATILYVTLEPCAMCAGAMIWSRIGKVVYGCADAKAGALGSVVNLNELKLNHRLEVTGGVLEQDCRDLLQNFFRARRRKSFFPNI